MPFSHDSLPHDAITPQKVDEKDESSWGFHRAVKS